MRKLFILIICCCVLASASRAQSNGSVYYEPVNIDSLLQQVIILPQGEQYTISQITFSLPAGAITDIGETGGVFRDRFIQLNQLSPEQDWQYRFGCVYFRVGNTDLALPFSKADQFDKLLKLYKSGQPAHLIIKAKMLIGKFKRYNITRDFQMEDIQVQG